ncbi:MAG TPA: OsmC family protein [Pseudonocardia sp.]|nr:OsmC family protein [Pseudonocardia sp.]
MAGKRSVQARWDGGLRAVVDAGGFELVVDEPESVPGGTGTGPQPTEYLLAAVASCFALALAHSAGKRGVELAEDLRVEATGTYDGPRFSAIAIDVRVSAPAGDELATLIAAAQRVCYVTRTLAGSPELSVLVDGRVAAGR